MIDKPQVKRYQNVLSEDQMATIRQLIDDGFAAGNDWHMDGPVRDDVDIILPEDIQKIFDDIAYSGWEFGEEHIHGYVKTTAIVYRPSGEDPEECVLHPHADSSTCGIILDYQLDTNLTKPWYLGIDDNVYTMENNEIIYLNANLDWHWRPYRLFQPGEYLINLLVQYDTRTLYLDRPEFLEVQDSKELSDAAWVPFRHYSDLNRKEEGK